MRCFICNTLIQQRRGNNIYFRPVMSGKYQILFLGNYVSSGKTLKSHLHGLINIGHHRIHTGIREGIYNLNDVTSHFYSADTVLPAPPTTPPSKALKLLVLLTALRSNVCVCLQLPPNSVNHSSSVYTGVLLFPA